MWVAGLPAAGIILERGRHRLGGDDGLGLLGGAVAVAFGCLAEAGLLALALGGDHLDQQGALAGAGDGRAVAACERSRNPRVRPSGHVQAGQLGVLVGLNRKWSAHAPNFSLPACGFTLVSLAGAPTRGG